MTPKPGEMHEVDKAFYKLTVDQRNAAWETIRVLEEKLELKEIELDRALETIEMLSKKVRDEA